MKHGRRHFLIAAAAVACGGLSFRRAQAGMATASAGMPAARLVAVVRRPPRRQGPALDHDAAAALALPGVVDVIPIHSGIAVLGTSLRQAKRGARALAVAHELSVEWAPGSLDGQDATVVAEDVLSHSARITPEPMNATVWFHDGGCEAWVPGRAGDQGGEDRVRHTLGDLAGLPRGRIAVHCAATGGDRYPVTEYLIEVAELARLTGRPVELVWTREDYIHYGLVRDSGPQRLRAALDDAGVSHALCDAPGLSCDAADLETFIDRFTRPPPALPLHL